MQESLMTQGFELLLAGMGMVFTFLTLLVFCTRLMSTVVSRFFPEPAEPDIQDFNTGVIAAPVDDKIVSVIQAAIREHRARR